MKKNTLVKITFIFAILSLAAALVILIFADGLRRWYSGGFFLFIGVLLLVKALFQNAKSDS